MEGRSLKHASYRLFTPGVVEPTTGAPATDEFDEFDVWGCGAESRVADARKPIPSALSRWKKAESGDRDRAPAITTGSLPVSIPDWSKILREEYRGNSDGYNINEGLEEEVDEEEEGYGTVIPPHELLWRNRAASLSVHEGIGRTLKGRDLSRVRNAIWEKIGFQD